MKVLLLDGSSNADSFSKQLCNMFVNELKEHGNEVNLVNLSDVKIAGCTGCFGCWVKTPGACVINDAGRDLAKSFIQSDLVISISPITFGGYSYELKKAMDRLIPVISPFFKRINGEIHHRARYKCYPNAISVGTLAENKPELIETFQNLVIRNAINMHNKVHLSRVFLHSETIMELEKEVCEVLKEAGEVR